MFSYQPISEDEAVRARFELLNDGNYQAVIRKVVPRNSSTGNPMLELDLDVYDDAGGLHLIKNYLVFSKKMMWKVIHCAKSAGVFKEYEEGKFGPAVLENKNVIVFVKTQQGGEIPSDKLNGKAPGARYPDKNVIEDFLEEGKLSPVESASKGHADLPFNDDGLPF